MVVANIFNAGKIPVAIDRLHTVQPGQNITLQKEESETIYVECGVIKPFVITNDTNIYVRCAAQETNECFSYGPKNIFFSRDNTKQCFETLSMDVLETRM